jgi:hypothetical protein
MFPIHVQKGTTVNWQKNGPMYKKRGPSKNSGHIYVDLAFLKRKFAFSLTWAKEFARLWLREKKKDKWSTTDS